MGRLLAETIPLALGAAISPVIFLLQLTTLTGSRPLIRGSALAAGAAVPLAIVGVIAVVTGGRVDVSGPNEVKGVIELALGVLLVGIGVRILLRAPKPPSGAAAAAAPHGAGGRSSSASPAWAPTCRRSRSTSRRWRRSSSPTSTSPIRSWRQRSSSRSP